MSSFLLYHGTTEAVARRAMVEGLLPRSKTGKTNWEHSVESNPDMVYLTTTYAPYFACSAAEGDDNLAIIEVRAVLLNERKFYPDEDFIAETLLRQGNHPRSEHAAWVKHARDNAEQYRRYWRQS
jgi:hypothetical protein